MQQELDDFYRHHKEVLVGGVLTRYFDSRLNISHCDDTRSVVVALHGIATSSYLYRNIIAEFDGPIRLIVPDLPGFGRSIKKLPWAAKYKHFINWLEGFLRTVLPFQGAPVKAHFIGHDFGALLAMAWAIEHPNEVSSLFCLNTCVHVEHIVPSPYLGMAVPPFIGQYLGRILAREQLLSRIFRRGFYREPEKKVVDIFMSVYRDPDARIVLSNFLHYLPNLSQLMWHLRRHIKDVKCPSYFMSGDQDRFIRPQESRALAELMSNAVYRCMPGVGHFLTEEIPLAVNAEFTAHLCHLGVEC